MIILSGRHVLVFAVRSQVNQLDNVPFASVDQGAIFDHYSNCCVAVCGERK